jgi:purine-nucleoside phosphorylase
MYGFTGTYNGKRVSVQGTGMGIPSISIYATELIKEYGVKRLVRIGSCGGMRPDLKLRDIIMARPLPRIRASTSLNSTARTTPRPRVSH